LKTDVLIAKGMQADDIHMDGVYVDERLVYCSMTMTAKRVMLYRTFRGDKGPRLSMVVRVLNSADFQLIVNALGGAILKTADRTARAKREKLLLISNFAQIQGHVPSF